MPAVGFEPTIPANERPQTHALDRAAAGIDINLAPFLVQQFNFRSKENKTG
jgi:hypothetical protein